MLMVADCLSCLKGVGAVNIQCALSLELTKAIQVFLSCLLSHLRIGI